MVVRPNVAVGIAVLALAVFFAAGVPFIENQGGYAGLSTRFVPMLVAAGLAVGAALLLINRESVTAQAEDVPEGQVAQLTGFGWLATGLVLHMVLIGSIGFVLASTVLMVCVARGYGSRKPLRDAVVALLLTIPIWLMFAKVLGISLPLLPLAGV